MLSLTLACVCLSFFSLQFKAFEEEEEARIKKDGQVVSPSLFYMKQTIGNACGTVGLLHAIGNCREKLAFSEFYDCLALMCLLCTSYPGLFVLRRRWIFEDVF